MSVIIKIVKYVITFGVVAVLIFASLNPTKARYAVLDRYRRATFTPSNSIQKITKGLQLTTKGRDTFYATQPTLVEPGQFSSVCPTSEESNVLGCYSSDLTYILDVEEKSIEAVEDVTAVHELLHGVWARLSDSSKRDIADQLNQVFENSDDKRLNDLIESYRQSDPGNDPLFIANELHSILATEVSDLTPELEEYYKQYLTDRSAIVTLFKSYNSEFETRQTKVANLQEQLADLRQEIEQKNNSVDALSVQNEQLTARINELRRQGKDEESNQLVPQQNALVAQIRSQVNQVNNLINRFNKLVEQNNGLALELNQLSESLDTRDSQ